jgi:hypothetical protein
MAAPGLPIFRAQLGTGHSERTREESGQCIKDSSLAEQSAERKDFDAQARCLVSTLGMTF